jgi:hypothetical protein
LNPNFYKVLNLFIGIALFFIGARDLMAGEGVDEGQITFEVEQTSEIGVGMRDGIDRDRDKYRPLREVFGGNRGKITKNTASLLWNVKWSGNRNLWSPVEGEEVSGRPHGRLPDEIYYPRRRHLINGSILDQNQELIVKDAYLQVLDEGWLLQVGSIRYAWGTADSINPISVMNPRDYRGGIVGEKDDAILSIPSMRLSRLGDGQSLTVVYVPVFEASIIPSAEQNWHLDLDNQRFRLGPVQDEKARPMGNVGLKYDLTIPDGDINLMVYNGSDSDLVAEPSSLLVVNNEPFILESRQLVPRKNSVGLAYQQTFGKWLAKVESLYTIDKLAPKSFERDQIESLSFPIEMRKTPHLNTTVGFNYFLSIESLFGLKLSETVWTTEYNAQRYLKAGVLGGLTGDLLVNNLRTGAFEDRLELFLTYIRDIGLQGDAKMVKAVFAGETLKHSVSLGLYDGSVPAGDDMGSAFYYWRTKDYLSYDLSYGF